MDTENKRGKLSGIFGNTAFYFIANVTQALIPLLLLPVLTRYLSPAEYGQVSIFQALVSGLLAVVGFNTVGAALRKYYDDDGQEALAVYIGSCLKILFVSLLLVSALVFLLRSGLSEFAGLSPAWLMLAILASAGLYLVNMRLGQWQVRGAAVRFGVLQIGNGLTNAAVSLILVLGFAWGADGRMAGIMLAPVLLGLISLYLLASDRLVSLKSDPASIRSALSFGIPLAPHVLGLFLLSAGDRFVINRLLGADSLGIYMVAMQLALGIGLAFDALNKAFVPWLFERLKRDLPHEKRKVVMFTYFCFVVAFLMAGLLVLVGPVLVYVAAGKEYHGAVQFLGWLAIGQAFQGLYLMVTNYMFFARKTGSLSLVTIFSGLLGILLMWLMVPWGGLVAATWAYAITMGIRFLLTWAMAQYCHPMPWLTFYKH